MIDIEFPKLYKKEFTDEMGDWLDEHMPNPPLPEQQRWELGRSEDGRYGFRFYNDHDATHFLLVWG